MLYKAVLNTGPAVYPVTLIEVKDHLRIEFDITESDALLDRMIGAATARTEGATGRRLISQHWTQYLDGWPKGDGWAVPFGKLQSVESVKYTDSAGAETTWAATEYEVDVVSDPGRVVLAYEKSFPTVTLGVVNPIAIAFTCGYGASGAAVPEDLRHAMLMLIAYWNENRETFLIGQGITSTRMREAFEDLTEAYKLWEFE